MRQKRREERERERESERESLEKKSERESGQRERGKREARDRGEREEREREREREKKKFCAEKCPLGIFFLSVGYLFYVYKLQLISTFYRDEKKMCFPLPLRLAIVKRIGESNTMRK